MQSLRSRSWLARLFLAWFALTLGAAVASPLVHPQSFELICTASGDIRMVALDDGSPMGHHQLDCPMCLSAGTPPPAAAQPPAARQLALAHALRPLQAAHIASVTRAPLPARGPPAKTPLPS